VKANFRKLFKPKVPSMPSGYMRQCKPSQRGRFLIRPCDLVRASRGRNGLICRLPGRGGCLGRPSTKWGGPGRPAGHTAARCGGARVRFPWPVVAHVRFGWATSCRSGGTILRGCARGLPPTHQGPRLGSTPERLEDLLFLPL
jgi:hypothetical protein